MDRRWVSAALVAALAVGVWLSPAVASTLWWVATGACLLAVALQDRWPRAMLALSALAVGAHLASGSPLSPADLAAPILLYTVALHLSRRTSLVALGTLSAVVVSCAVYAWPGVPDPDAVLAMRADSQTVASGGLVLMLAVLVAVWALGSARRLHLAYLGQVQTLAVAAERSRISRELHDVVAHGLSVMVVQAQGAQAALATRPQDTRRALGSIIQVGRDSLADMRRVLGAACATEATATTGESWPQPGLAEATTGESWQPQPGLAELPRLVAQVSQAGVPVRLEVQGQAVALPSTVELSGYRIVQEALTNTVKHAGEGAKAGVVLRYLPHEVQLEVWDDGVGSPGEAGEGLGLSGMRGRAKLLDGDLIAGNRPGGGFVVRARLPWRPA